MQRTSLDNCCTRSEMPHPCWGSRHTVRRIRRSRVLGADRCVTCFLFCFYTKDSGGLVEVQGERWAMERPGLFLGFRIIERYVERRIGDPQISGGLCWERGNERWPSPLRVFTLSAAHLRR